MGPRACVRLFAGLLLALAGCPKEEPVPDAMGPGEDLAAGETDGQPQPEDGPVRPPDLRRQDGAPPDLGGDLPPHPPAPFVPVCTPSKWCWENPLPQGNALPALWSFSANDVWAAGGLGTILHYDGMKWAAVPSGTEAGIGGLWGSAPDNLWATCGDGSLLRWNGTAWSRVPGGTTNALGPIWGTGPADIWAGGDKGTMVHWDGTAWSAVPSGVAYAIQGVFGNAPNNYWATFATGGVGSPVIRWDGSAWSRVTRYPATNYAKAVFGAHPDRVWFFSPLPVLFSGGVYAPHTPVRAVPVMAAWGHTGSETWSVGGQSVGRIKSWTDRWDLAPAPRMDRDEALLGISGTSAGDVWTTSYRPHHWNGSSWASTGSGAAGGSRPLLAGGWAAGADDAWVVGTELDAMGKSVGIILRRKGGAWHKDYVAPQPLSEIWGIGKDDVWVVGAAGLILHWDGTNWNPSPSGSSKVLLGVHGIAANKVFAVGLDGTILAWNGMSWTTVSSGTTEALYKVWASAANDAWAVGLNGTLLRWNGTSWMRFSLGVITHLFSIWGANPNDIWIGSSNGIFHHWNGSTWNATPSGIASSIADIYGKNADDIWAVGEQPVHWNGTRWVRIAGPIRVSSDVFGSSGDTWIVGGNADIVRHVP